METPPASIYHNCASEPTELRDIPVYVTIPVQHPDARASEYQGGGGLMIQNRPAQTSLADTLKTCIPEDSAMMRSIRARRPNALLVNEKHPEGLRWELQTIDSNLSCLRENPPRSGGSTLIVQDIDQGWGQALISKYPQQVCAEFLAKHMIRLDSRSAVLDATEVPTSTWRAIRKQGRFDFEQCLLRGLTSSLRDEMDGFHIDCDFSSVTQSPRAWSTTHAIFANNTGVSLGRIFGGHEREPSEMTEKIVIPKIWKKSRTRISCCELEDQFYLVLVEAITDFVRDHEPLWDSSNEDPFQSLLSFSFNMGNELPFTVLRSPIVSERGMFNGMITTVLRLFQHHTPHSVFQPKNMPEFNPLDVPDSNGKCHIMVWLLVESTWQLAVASLDSRLQRIRRSAANGTSDEAFSMLRTFRRELADARMLVAELRERFVQAVGEAESWIVALPTGPINARAIDKMDVDAFWSQERAKSAPVVFGRAQTMDIRNLPETLKGLEDWIHAMAQTVNEEIQVVIGSVQVEDAKTMKRQTEVTVVLAVLAAIYLPMTLVTGIFGMNINEINQGVPYQIWVVKVWSWVFSVTILPILVYVIVRWVIKWSRNRRRNSRVWYDESIIGGCVITV